MANCRQRLAQKPVDNTAEQPVQLVNLPRGDSSELRMADKFSSLVPPLSVLITVDVMLTFCVILVLCNLLSRV